MSLPDTLAAGATPYPEAVVDSFSSANTYGFMTIERLGQQWLMKSWDRDGKLMTSCALKNQKTVCTH